MLEKRYATRKELSIILTNKIKELKQSLERVNGKNYPKKKDFKGWELYGKMQALAWVKIMYVEAKCFKAYLNKLNTLYTENEKKEIY